MGLLTPFDCPNCHGLGFISYWDEDVPGDGLRSKKGCPSCGGSGIDPELRDEFKHILKVAPAYSPEFTVTDHADQLATAVVAYWREKE